MTKEELRGGQIVRGIAVLMLLLNATTLGVVIVWAIRSSAWVSPRIVFGIVPPLIFYGCLYFGHRWVRWAMLAFLGLMLLGAAKLAYDGEALGFSGALALLPFTAATVTLFASRSVRAYYRLERLVGKQPLSLFGRPGV